MNARQKEILDLLQTSDQDLRSLSKHFSVAEMTIRRDLKLLEDAFGVVLSRGRVMLYDKFDKNVNVEETKQTLKRNAIVEALYKRIFPTNAIFLSGGKTTLALANYIVQHCREPLTIVTNSLAIGSTIFRGTTAPNSPLQCKVILLGGEFRTGTMDLMGPVAEKNLLEYHVDWLISGCDAADVEKGLYTSDLSISNLEKNSLQIADNVAIVTDSSKFSKKALVKFADFSHVNILATDDELSPAQIETLSAQGVEVIIAKSK